MPNSRQGCEPNEHSASQRSDDPRTRADIALNMPMTRATRRPERIVGPPMYPTLRPSSTTASKTLLRHRGTGRQPPGTVPMRQQTTTDCPGLRGSGAPV
jgi:hypothetical protein